MKEFGMGPLKDLLVLDFSTLLPGPMASLILADAGAQIIKIERPVGGDDMRGYSPIIEGQSVNFAMLNRGKLSIGINLKDPTAKDKLRPLIQKADIIIEQFRPGVMTRLGLGYQDIRSIKPDIIYCSITGWGQTGPKASEAGHDLNYMAETGVLGLSVGVDGAPILPPILAADIAGGTYPAIVNILLALRQRDKTGQGCWIDVAMGENLFPFIYWALGNANALRRWPLPGKETVTGGTPRYQIYRTKDHKFIAAAPLEDKFWKNFTSIIGLSEEFCDDSLNAEKIQEAVAHIIATKDAVDWMRAFSGTDVCCSLVLSLEESLKDPQWQARSVFTRDIEFGTGKMPALPSIISPSLRHSFVANHAPKLGADQAILLV